jgi:glyoxylase-like metal-dependent hydrolase (beta-lactamase superfamily II)
VVGREEDDGFLCKVMEPKLPLRRIVLPGVNVYLIQSGERYMLVDTGRRISRKLVVQKLNELGVSPNRVSVILLTHTHFDHAGGACMLKKLSGAQLMVHRSEALNLKRGYSSIPRGTRRKSKIISVVGKLFFPYLGFFPGVEADILVDKELDLHEMGFPAKVYHVGGHTKGSMIVVLDDGQAIVGDNMLGVGGPKRFPPFANDVEGVKQCWALLDELGVVTMWPAHGVGVRAADAVASSQ